MKNMAMLWILGCLAAVLISCASTDANNETAGIQSALYQSPSTPNNQILVTFHDERVDRVPVADPAAILILPYSVGWVRRALGKPDGLSWRLVRAVTHHCQGLACRGPFGGLRRAESAEVKLRFMLRAPNPLYVGRAFQGKMRIAADPANGYRQRGEYGNSTWSQRVAGRLAEDYGFRTVML